MKRFARNQTFLWRSLMLTVVDGGGWLVLTVPLVCWEDWAGFVFLPRPVPSFFVLLK